VSQIDFAPSLSYLLGVPVPFGNIGRVIDELVPEDAKKGALLENARQVAFIQSTKYL
jgi:hypothetical protein